MLERYKCINENVNLDDYLKLYKYVRDNMEYPQWLGTFTKEEIEEILSMGGKVWLYYDNENLVCSMFYIPIKNKSLLKHNVTIDEKLVGSLGPIMVSPDYIGHGLQREMMNLLEEYCKSINKTYIFTKVCTDNYYSLNNMIKCDYKVTEKYINERGSNTALIKKLKTKHEMKLQPKYFDYILNGTKKVELRLNNEKRKNIRIGDKIKFLKEPNLDESFEATVINLYYFDSFEELFKHFDISTIADKSMTKDKLICDLEKFYTKEKQKEYGVLGIEIILDK